MFVRPETILRWHRDLLRRRWRFPHRKRGRPPVAAGTVTLVRRLAMENPTWGYRRIRGELATMGVKLAASSVWVILRRHGINPAPPRHEPGAETDRPDVDRVFDRAGSQHAGLRFLQC